MYNPYFGLQSPPFRITPDTRRFFGGGQRAAVLETLKYAILSGDGMIKVTGEVGTGKTMLCRMLQEQMPAAVTVVYLANPSLSRDEILHAIALELGLEDMAASRHFELQQTLTAHLLSEYRAGRRVVIFIEEAQCMPLETLEEIRLLSNLETRQDKLLQLVMFAQPELDQLLQKKELRQLRDRISLSLELQPLQARDVRNYVRFRLHCAGQRGGDPFTRGAYLLLSHASNSLIRRIHILADKALLAAYANDTDIVRWRHMRQAIRDSEFHGHALLAIKPWLSAGLTAVLVVSTMIGWQSWANNRTTKMATIARQTPALVDRGAVRPNPKQPQIAQPLPRTALAEWRLKASQRWLSLPGKSGQLTIQVMLTDDDKLQTLEKLLQSEEIQPLTNQLYLQKTTIGGRQRWNVLFGEFADKKVAQQALVRLPAGLQAQRPFLRSLRRMRESFKTAMMIKPEKRG